MATYWLKIAYFSYPSLGALAPYVPFGILRWSQACWKLESWGYPPVKTGVIVAWVVLTQC